MENSFAADAAMLADALEPAGFAAALIQSRRTVLPKRLVAPGPDRHELHRILESAAAAPDHDQRMPWRFIVVPPSRRADLADVFENDLRERDPQATAAQLAQAREKAFRSPTLLVALVRMGPEGDDIPLAERLLSTGCALQNVLLMATALGFGSSLTSGKALPSQGMRRLLGLEALEQAVCFVSIGTAPAVQRVKARPAVQSYVRELPVARVIECAEAPRAAPVS